MSIIVSMKNNNNSINSISLYSAHDLQWKVIIMTTEKVSYADRPRQKQPSGKNS